MEMESMRTTEERRASLSAGPRHEPPPHASLYLLPTYWDKRFATEQHYEWFKEYSHFRHLLLSYIKPTDRVLEVGAGSSRLSEEMYKDGITRITCTDLSPIAVEHMQERFQATPGMVAAEADMLNLPFDDHSFDVVIEKGALDVLFVDSGDPWKPKLEVTNRVHSMLTETHRVLVPTGLFISIAFGQPHFRRPLFEAEGFTWSMQWVTFGDTFHYFFYMLRKGTAIFKPVPMGPSTLGEKVNMEHEHMDSEDFLLHSTLLDDD